MSDPATLAILVDIRARLDELSATQKGMKDVAKDTKDATKEAVSFSQALKTGLGIDVVRRGSDLLTRSLRTLVFEGFAMASALKDSAENATMSTEAYQVLRLVFKEVGGEAALMDLAISHNNQTLLDARTGIGAAAAAYRKLHLDASSLEGLPVERRMEVYARAIMNADDKTEAFGATSVILGSRKLPILLGVMRELATQGYDKLASAAKNTGQVMESETIQRLDRAEKMLEKFKRQAVIAAGESVGDLLGSNPTFAQDIANVLGGAFNYAIKLPGQAMGSMAANALNMFGGRGVTFLDDAIAEEQAKMRTQELADLLKTSAAQRAQAETARALATQRNSLADADLNLSKASMARQAKEDDPTQSDISKREKVIELLKREYASRAALIDLLSKQPLEDNERPQDRAEKLLKMGYENRSTDRRIQSLGFPIPRIQSSRESFDSVNDPNGNRNYIRTGEGAKVGAQDWVSSLGSKGEQIASAMQSSIGGAVQNISQGIWGWMTGASSFGDMVLNLGGMIGQTLLQTVIQIGVQWLVSAALAKTGLLSISATSSVLRAKETGEVLAAEGAKAPPLMANAAAANAGSFGMAAVIGIALLLAMMAMFAGGRERGGDVQSGRAYVVGEKRPELFLPGISGTILPSLDIPGQRSAVPSAGAGLAVGAALAGAAAASTRSKPSRVVVVDNRKVADQLRDDPNFKTIVQDLLRGDPSAFGIAT